MSEADEVLEKAEQVLDERGWCAGFLTNPEDYSHCALGAIGYATMGEQFDKVAVSAIQYGSGRTGYDMLASSEEARAAVFALANVVRASQGRKPLIPSPVPEAYYADPDRPRGQVDPEVSDAMQSVMSFNDVSEGRRRGRNRVHEAFRDTWKSLRALRAEKKKKTPVDHPMEREIVVPPISAAQQVQTVKEVK